MSITTAIAQTAKKEFFDGVHLSSHTYKCLLLKVGAAGTYSKLTTGVGTPGSGSPSSSNVGTDEASGTGYSSGGVALTRNATSAGDTVYLDFDDAVWAAASLSAIGCIIYNDTVAGKPVLMVQDFGGTITSTAAEFRVAIANLLSLAG
jgi:hypothetical protein